MAFSDHSVERFDSRATRILAFSGILLIVAGMVLGDLFAIYVLHQSNAAIGQAMYAAVMAIPDGDVDAVMAQFQTVAHLLEKKGTKIDAHNHAVLLGYIAVLLAILQLFVAWSGRAKVRLAWIYVISATILPVAVYLIHYVGLAYSPSDAFGWASIATQPTAFLIGVVVAVELAGLMRGTRAASPVPVKAAGLAPLSGPGRVLVIGGSLLLLGGFLYGAGFAAYLQYLLSPTEPEVLHQIIAAAVGGQSVDAAFNAYGGVLAFRGIHVAAHAHVNTMGILVFLLAFLQPFIFLSEQWKKRWAWTLVLACFALPVCVLLEFVLGRIAGGMADLSGAMAIVALLAMLTGLVRRTGVEDGGDGGAT